MPLRLYICKKCNKQIELFDDEVKDYKGQCLENTCFLEQKPVDSVHTTGITEGYANRHIYYDSMPERTKWNAADMKEKEKEEQAKKFQEGLKKL